ncbi:SMP-30/gluconolactonase/LRE family protein [Roseomonas sp. OT10]|uniref:SMP-30/gluconolactonase/LRE family protein n=1 Tax=Roseomonas cutis TaxID=2897332 RepID=UPI001E63790C|nr:SMP-30/gluconolactonase/LRE family protein [Roseomonas sp. OT10]UFN48559.1 SMP-30/gluconolactonase/LRE family protein [Roseomonas sp. OT10]
MTGASDGDPNRTPRNETPWESSPRYPDRRIRSLDPSFDRYRLMNAGVEKLAGGTRWGEGPVWFGAHRCLLWSDIPNNRILRWDEETGGVTVFRRPSNFANGNTRDREGRLVTCEHGARRVTRTEHDGRITVIADGHEGRRLNSPNDVVVKSDGTIWFTDPLFGILGDYEGDTAESERPMAVYRADPARGTLAVVAEGINAPNGLAFSPDESLLYIVESRAEPRRIVACAVRGDGTLGEPRPFITTAPGETPDGFRLDEAGNLWCGWGMGEGMDGVRVFNSAGAPIGQIDLPERAANVAFGGRHRNRLFMAGSRSLYSVFVHTRGCAGG